METDRSPTAARLRLSLVPLVRRLRQHNDEGMTANHVAALSTVLRLGPVTFGELAEAEHVSAPMITKIARSLEGEALVTRVVDETDRRVHRLEITPLGRRRLEQGRQRKNAWLADRLATLTPDELATLEAALPLLERLGQEPGR